MYQSFRSSHPFRALRDPLRFSAGSLAPLSVFCAFFFMLGVLPGAETPWVKAVEAVATVNDSAPSITLTWKADTNENKNNNGYYPAYTVYRRTPGGTWESGIAVANGAHTYVDNAVQVGTPYEYHLFKQFNNYGMVYEGHGYVRSGINLPAIHQRGKVALVVDSQIAAGIAANLDLFEMNLVGDGWRVVTISGYGRNDSAAAIRSAIQAEYNAQDPEESRLKTVFIIGHIPVVHSGNYNADGHAFRPMPADAYYGDMSGNWGTNSGTASAPVYPPSEFPGPIQLQVGRVDMFGLPVFTTKTETQLLNDYLDKDHGYRHRNLARTSRSLIGDQFGDHGGDAFSSAAFINFAPMIGTGSGAYTIANIEPGDQTGRWLDRVSDPATPDYLWVFAAGAGSVSAIGAMGAYGVHNNNELWVEDLVAEGARGTFYLMFGSWFGEWDKQNNIMRTTVALPGYGLSAAWAGRPYLYFHGMGMGDTIGEGIRTSQNYDTSGNNDYFTPFPANQVRKVHIALMGDPTLRLHPIAPVSALGTSVNGANVLLSWTASGDSVLGYHVYRATSLTGPYSRITTGAPVTGANYTDVAPGSGTFYYMVRAIRRETSPSGTYDNLSQGIFALATVGGSQVATPTFSPGAGAYSNAQLVTIATSTGGAAIRYTVNGPDPTPTTGTLYSSPVSVPASQTLRAIAYKSGMIDSAVATATYTITTGDWVWFDDALPSGASPSTNGDNWSWVSSAPAANTGTFSHQSALLNGLHEHSFNFASATMNMSTGESLFAWVYIDAANPPREVMLHWRSDNWEHRAYWGENLINSGTNGTNSRRYVGPLPVGGSWIRLEVPAAQVGLEGHSVGGMTFSHYDGRATWDSTGRTAGGPPSNQVATPTFSPAAGTYSSAQLVTIATSTSGAAIRYTVDGPNPTPTTGTLYSGTVSVPSSQTLRAIAYKSGMIDSAVATATYTITTGDWVWFDDALPAGASPSTNGDNWSWVSSAPAANTGTLSHQSALLNGLHEHSFNFASAAMNVSTGESLFAWVFLDAGSPPSEIMLSWKSTNWEHRAYWGQNLISYGTNGTASRRYVGPLPAAGQWVRLTVPALDVALEGASVVGMAFSHFNGRATWDSTGRTAGGPPPPPENVWFDEALPAGAVPTTNGDSWNWVSSNPAAHSGSVSHQSALLSGVHEHSFNFGAPMSVGTGQSLFAWVYIDAANPPREVMLHWRSDNWEHRAYWGENLINSGTNGTNSRRYVGPLPSGGIWVRLEVPAAQVGLGGHSVVGMTFSHYDGRATWDGTGTFTP